MYVKLQQKKSRLCAQDNSQEKIQAEREFFRPLLQKEGRFLFQL